jgi:hypothetical protein
MINPDDKCRRFLGTLNILAGKCFFLDIMFREIKI